MFSYFSIVEKHDAAHFASKALLERVCEKFPQYEISFKCRKMCILTAGAVEKGIGVYRLASGKGAILGTVFGKNSENCNENVAYIFDESQTHSIVSTNGKMLTSKYWGMYVSFIVGDSGSVTVVRDPCGWLPAYFFETEDFYLFFSDSYHFRCVSELKFSINLVHLASFAKNSFLDYVDTGIDQIKKVLPGEAVTIANGAIVRETYWHPRDFCAARGWEEDAGQAMSKLRKTIEDCIEAWSSHFDKIATHLSGGLDSSIVLSCLSRSSNSRELLALTYYSTVHGSTDERGPARLAANHSSVRLFEKEDRPEDVDVSILTKFRYLAEPTRCRTLMAYGAFEREFADLHGIDAYFGGDGGDNILYQGSENSAIDFVWHHGISKEIFQISLENAKISKNSVWNVMFSALGSRFSDPKFDINAAIAFESSVTNEELIKSIDLNERCAHWADRLHDVSVAKQKHVAMTRFSNHYRLPNCHAHEVRSIEPLFSQPILEAVYGIPAYMFSYRGIDRGLARFAFKDVIHPGNCFRRSKGSPDLFYRAVFERNIQFYREYLLEGILVKKNVLDKVKLEKALTPGSLTTDWLYLNEYIGGEMWAREWITTP